MNFNSELLTTYEKETKDNYSDCATDRDIIAFLARYIKWLEKLKMPN